LCCSVEHCGRSDRRLLANICDGHRHGDYHSGDGDYGENELALATGSATFPDARRCIVDDNFRFEDSARLLHDVS
jgi:hypothetical protein